MDHRHKDNELLAEKKEYNTNIFHRQISLQRNSTKKELEYVLNIIFGN